MADTTRSLASLQALLADNIAGDISAQDVRDFLVSAYKPQVLIPGGRLTLTTGVPVTTTDVTGATNVYYTPYLHNGIGLYDGTSWTLFTFTERTLALGTLSNNTNYDVFLYDNSGTLTLESLAWTDDTTRATALTTQDGVYVKSGATTRRYLGTFRTTATTTTEDSAAKRFLWNAYNRVTRGVGIALPTNYTYATNTYRELNGSSSYRLQVVAGLATSLFSARWSALEGGGTYRWGVAEDGTSAPNTGIGFVGGGNNPASTYNMASTEVRKIVAVGYHYYTALEKSTSGTSDIYTGSLDGTTLGVVGEYQC